MNNKEVINFYLRGRTMTDTYNRPYQRGGSEYQEEGRYEAPAPRYDAPAPAPRYEAPAPAPRYEAPAPAPAPAPRYEAPAPAPRYDAPAPAPRYEAPYYEEPRKDYSKYDDSFLMSEIGRLKNETNDIRRILEERNLQIEKLQSAILTGMSGDELLKGLTSKFNSLSEQLEEMEDALTDQLERNRPGKESMKLVSEELTQKLDGMRMEVESASDKMTAAKDSVDSLNEVLENKAEKKSLTMLHQRVSTLFAMSAINIVGTLMTLGLLCYLIFSLAR